MNPHDEAHLFDGFGEEEPEVCEGCGSVVDADELEWGHESGYYVCEDCLEHPPAD
jgi:hypothetical protein